MDRRKMARGGKLSGAAVFGASALCVACLAGALSAGESKVEGAPPGTDVQTIARQCDDLIRAELSKAGTPVAPAVGDEDFLRRVSFDLVGRGPSPREVTLFVLDSDPAKRQKAIDRLVGSEDFAANWARYWREVIFSRATDARARFAQQPFETWMTQQLAADRGWGEITTEMLTATGDVREVGQTAMLFAQSANAEEIAAETSRVFLGIQLQCANCHDHPTDKWTRREFHELAAYFPRMRIQQKMEPRTFEIVSVNAAPGGGRGGPGELFRNPERLFEQVDRNKDGKIVRDEFPGEPGKQFFDRIVQRADTDKDGAISLAEMKALPPPPMGPRRGSTEHFMPDLEHPSEQGTRMEPVFFVDHSTPGQGIPDLDRRKALAAVITSSSNPWFARAFINRMWAELLGQGFYMPVDDLGPERSCTHPEVLDLLAKEFATRNYDIRWLFRTIANTDAYQRSLRPHPASETPAAFASASTTRLRADQLFDAIRETLGYQDVPGGRGPMGGGGGGRFGGFGRRAQFNRLFGFDPSTPFDEITGTVPQALFLMNSRALNELIRARGQTPLARILNENTDDADALSELYLLMLSREPSARESEIARSYIKEVGNRQEAFEDLQWSLLNSTEFLNKR